MSLQYTSNRDDSFEEEDSFKKGDILQFNRGLYYHEGVYVGDGEVVHKVPDQNKSNSFSISGVAGPAAVKKEKLEDVQNGDPVYIKQDRGRTPLESEEIAEIANNSIGRTTYNPCCDNCQSFASKCRYGKAESDAVTMVQNVAIGAAVGVAAFAAVKIGIAWFSGSNKEKESKK